MLFLVASRHCERSARSAKRDASPSGDSNEYAETMFD